MAYGCWWAIEDTRPVENFFCMLFLPKRCICIFCHVCNLSRCNLGRVENKTPMMVLYWIQKREFNFLHGRSFIGIYELIVWTWCFKHSFKLAITLLNGRITLKYFLNNLWMNSKFLIHSAIHFNHINIKVLGVYNFHEHYYSNGVVIKRLKNTMYPPSNIVFL